MLPDFPDGTEVIDSIRNLIGRDVTFYTEYKVPCSACSIDPVTNTSVNPFCIVCSGIGRIITLSGTPVLAHITHAPAQGVQWVSGGQLPDGDCLIQIKYSAENVTIIDNCSYVLVDEQKFDIKKRILRGVKQLNRIILSLIERA
jgi:hypothetical protein